MQHKDYNILVQLLSTFSHINRTSAAASKVTALSVFITGKYIVRQTY